MRVYLAMLVAVLDVERKWDLDVRGRGAGSGASLDLDSGGRREGDGDEEASGDGGEEHLDDVSGVEVKWWVYVQ